jgi:hypothetical protein
MGMKNPPNAATAELKPMVAAASVAPDAPRLLQRRHIVAIHHLPLVQGAEDGRDHAESGAVADPGAEKQNQEHRHETEHIAAALPLPAERPRKPEKPPP